MKYKKLPDNKILPTYKRNILKFIPLILSVIPVVSLLNIIRLLPLIHKKKYPKALYHFVGEGDFEKIIKNKILLSLAGGKLHAASEMNPSLGRSNKKDNNYYLFIIEQPNDIRKFEPIINAARVLHAYKWWKTFRNEYTYYTRNDIGFELEKNNVYTKNININGRDVIFNVAYIQNLVPLENDLPVYKKQKKYFYYTEVALSIFLFYIPSMISVILLHQFLSNAPFTALTPFVIPLGFITFLAFITFAVIKIFFHKKIRDSVIASRGKDIYIKSEKKNTRDGRRIVKVDTEAVKLFAEKISATH